MVPSLEPVPVDVVVRVAPPVPVPTSSVFPFPMLVVVRLGPLSTASFPIVIVLPLVNCPNPMAGTTEELFRPLAVGPDVPPPLVSVPEQVIVALLAAGLGTHAARAGSG